MKSIGAAKSQRIGRAQQTRANPMPSHGSHGASVQLPNEVNAEEGDNCPLHKVLM
jgi:hypothetical protein